MWKVLDVELHGSRLRGQARDNSDLDAAVSYEGDIREDDLFNALNEDPLFIEDVRVDINPIKEQMSSYMKRSNNYDSKMLNRTEFEHYTDRIGENMKPIKHRQSITLEDRIAQLEALCAEAEKEEEDLDVEVDEDEECDESLAYYEARIRKLESLITRQRIDEKGFFDFFRKKKDTKPKVMSEDEFFDKAEKSLKSMMKAFPEYKPIKNLDVTRRASSKWVTLNFMTGSRITLYYNDGKPWLNLGGQDVPDKKFEVSADLNPVGAWYEAAYKSLKAQQAATIKKNKEHADFMDSMHKAADAERKNAKKKSGDDWLGSRYTPYTSDWM